MRKKLFCTLLISVISIFSLTGCGAKKEGLEALSKEEIITAYTALSQNYSALEQENKELNELYNSLNVDSKPIPAIGYVGDATGALTFNSRDAKIIFPNTFQYPGAQQLKAIDLIVISESITVSPGANWIVKLNGTTIELEHSNGISGIIKVGKVDTVFSATQIRDEVLAPWFADISNSKITYSDLFTSNSQAAVGTDATLPILIDKEDAFLRCGMVCSNYKAITYVFTYRSQQDINKDESIVNVINSIKIGNESLVINK